MRRTAAGLVLIAVAPLFGHGVPEVVPAGAISRLGSAAFRSEYILQASYYAADGKSVIGCTPECIYQWESQTGRLIRRFRIADEGGSLSHFRIGSENCFAHNPAGKTVACLGFANGRLEIQNWDLQSGKKLFGRKTNQCLGLE